MAEKAGPEAGPASPFYRGFAAERQVSASIDHITHNAALARG